MNENELGKVSGIVSKLCAKTMNVKGSPKIVNFKAKNKISKVTLPDWLIKWQTKCAESPPSRFFFIKIGPPKDKITPKNNFDSPKMKKTKAKVTTGGKTPRKDIIKNKDQNVQKENENEKNRAEKSTSSKIV